MSLGRIPSVFRAYDIRGLTGTELTPNFFKVVGCALGARLQKITSQPTVCVGHDTRASSVAFYESLIDGLRAAGCDVLALGLSTTPLVLWAEHYLSQHLSCDAAMNITGSHTDATRNGLKISFQKKPFYGDDLKRLRDDLASATSMDNKEKRGHRTEKRLCTAYIDSLLEKFDFSPDMPRVLWDLGHGAATCFADVLAKKLGGSHAFVGTDPKPAPRNTFDPLNKNAVQKRHAAMQKNNAAFAFAFDGDGDRLVVMDKRGTVWEGDELLLFFAAFQKDISRPVVADVKSSPLLLSKVVAHRTLHISPTGHAHLKTHMTKTGASLGGEVSGHFFFKDAYFGFDDGLYAALRFLDIISANNLNPALWHESLPSRFKSPELRLPMPALLQDSILKDCRTWALRGGYQCNEIDGLKAVQEDGWWIVRSSQTEPMLVLRFEANNVHFYNKIKNSFSEILAKNNWKDSTFAKLC